jgi:hypothetical protein
MIAGESYSDGAHKTRGRLQIGQSAQIKPYLSNLTTTGMNETIDENGVQHRPKRTEDR